MIEARFVDVQRRRSRKPGPRPVAGIVVQERSASQQLILEVGKLAPVAPATDSPCRGCSSAIRYPCGTTIEVGHSSIARSTGLPGCSGCTSSWRVIGAVRPWTGSGRACGAKRAASPGRPAYAGRSRPQTSPRADPDVKTRNTRNRSASSAEEEIRKFAASGPVISVSSVSGCETNVNPSPIGGKADLRVLSGRLQRERLIGGVRDRIWSSAWRAAASRSRAARRIRRRGGPAAAPVAAGASRWRHP